MRCLFIGGEADGTWREVGDGEERIYVAVAQKPAVKPRFDLETSVVELKQEVYIREQFRVGIEKYFIYRWAPLAMNGAFQLLLEGYRQPRSR